MMFKPTIEEIIMKYGLSNKILLPKNSGLIEMISKSLDFNLSDYTKINKEEYTNGKIIISLCRGEDISSIIEDIYMKTGERIIGITGDDLFDEYKLRNENTIISLLETFDGFDPNTKYGRPALCFSKLKGKELKGDIYIAINEKYKETSIAAINEIKNKIGFNPIFRFYSGGTEKTVKVGLNDACVEIVYTGKSLIENSLEEVCTLRYSDLALVGIDINSPECFRRDYKNVNERVINPIASSYTSKLASDPNKAIKKLGEEFAEFTQAIVLYRNSEDKEMMRKEIAKEYRDLCYLLAVNSAMCGVPFGAITTEMNYSIIGGKK